VTAHACSDGRGRFDRASRLAHGVAPTVGAVFALLALILVVWIGQAGTVALAADRPVRTAALGGSADAFAMATEARVGVHPDKTRFVLDLTQTSPVQVAADGSGREVTIDLSAIAVMPRDLPVGRGLIARVRQSAPSGPGSRLVVETAGPVTVAWAAVIPPQDGRPPRFVLDLVPAVAAAPAVAATASPTPPATPAPVVSVSMTTAPARAVPPAAVTPPAASGTAPGTAPGTASGPVAVARPSASLDRRVVPVAIGGMGAAVPVPRPRPSVPERPLIVIDPGHGGQDPGATAVNGMFEKDITLSTAKELKAQLEATGRYRVTLTRSRDAFIRLRDRVAIAREAGADLFISLHADSIGRKGVRGLSVYTLSDKATDREAEMLAQRENRADSVAGLDLTGATDDVVSVLISLAQRDTRNQSLRFAALVVGEAGKGGVTLLNRPQRSAGFAVLTAPDVPSVLIELGYLSDPRDAKLLASGAHRRALARTLVRAIDGYFRPGLLAARS
jgi:N-acetylmuramoyl-L-alanine amidase